MRKSFIAGNWKMNKVPSEAALFIQELGHLDLDDQVESCICVPYVTLGFASNLLKGSEIRVGAQNMFDEDEGAYTGEVSALMLKDLDVDYVILGHSERRQYFNEDDEFINRKIHQALKHDLRPILCVGESLEEREAGQEKDKVKNQLKANLAGVDAEDFSNIVIAYEPIWAIGTGKTASSDDAEAMCKFIREEIESLYGEDAGESVRIQYGGSVKPGNIKELMGKNNIDGALVGGAGLEIDDFEQLVNYRKN